MRRPLKELAAGLGLLAAGWVAARVLIFIVLQICPPVLAEWSSGAVRLARECLERIPELAMSENAAIFFSGSVTRYGLSEKEFTDQAAARDLPLKPFLFGYTVATPGSQVHLARRIQSALRTSGRPARLTAIELKPDALNEAFQKRYQRAIHLRKAILMEPSALFATLLRDPAMGSELLGMKALGGLAPDMITGLARETLYETVVNGLDGEALKRKYEFPGALTLFHRERDSELRFDRKEEREIVELVSLLKSVSLETIIYIPPYDRNLLVRGTQSWSELERLKASLISVTGAKILDFSAAPGFEGRDFVEGYHFTSQGIGKFSKLLSSSVLDAL